MAVKIKNPLSVFLGQTLQGFRKGQGVRAEDVSSALGIAPSAYRMIESGYASLNPSRVLSLLTISCFQSIVYEKIAKLLTGIQVLDPLKNNPTQLASAFEQLMSADKELAISLKAESINFKDILAKPAKLDAFLGDSEIIDNFRTYLIFIDNLSFESLNKELDEIINNTSCILIPFVDAQVKQVRSQIDIIKSISNIKGQVNESRKRIQALNDYQLGLLEPNTVIWRNKHKFQSTTGIFWNYKNLNNQHILDKFKDNLRQLWNTDFTQLGYIIIAEKKSLPIVKKLLKVFKEHIQELFVSEIKNPYEAIDFKEGFGKIKIGVLSQEESILKEIGIYSEKDELWFYEDIDDFRYTIKTEFTGSLQYSEATDEYNDIEVLQFKYLNGGDTQTAFELLEQLWERTEIIKF